VRLACLAFLLAVPACEVFDPPSPDPGPTGPPSTSPILGCVHGCDAAVVAAGSPIAYLVQEERSSLSYSVAVTCEGVPCQVTPPSPGGHTGLTTFEVVGLGDGELAVHVQVTDAVNRVTNLDASQEIRTVTGIAFACTIGGAACGSPIPAGSDVRVTAQADSAEGPFADADVSLTIAPDEPHTCDGDACELPGVAAGTIDVLATEHDVMAEDLLTVH
jgi:hypothetical protein